MYDSTTAAQIPTRPATLGVSAAAVAPDPTRVTADRPPPRPRPPHPRWQRSLLSRRRTIALAPANFPDYAISRKRPVYALVKVLHRAGRPSRMPRAAPERPVAARPTRLGTATRGVGQRSILPGFSGLSRGQCFVAGGTDGN